MRANDFRQLLVVIGTIGASHGLAWAQALEPGDNGDSETSQPPEAANATVTNQGGVFIVDASDGKNYVDVAEAGRSFNTLDDFLFWVAQTFGGTIVYDRDAQAKGVHGISVTYGTPYYADGNSNRAVPVDDMIAAVVAGRGGIVTIAGEQYCLRADGCLGDQTFKARPPESSSNCDPNSRFCIGSESFNHKFPPLVSIYRSVGTETTQTRGGLRAEAADRPW
jgi:hypothetical protein